MKKLSIPVVVVLIPAILAATIACSSSTPATAITIIITAAITAYLTASTISPAAENAAVLISAAAWSAVDPVTGNLRHFGVGFNQPANGDIKTRTSNNGKRLFCQSVFPRSTNLIRNPGGSLVALGFAKGYQAVWKGVVTASLQSSPTNINCKMNEARNPRLTHPLSSHDLYQSGSLFSKIVTQE